jgi:hypothetical protein
MIAEWLAKKKAAWQAEAKLPSDKYSSTLPILQSYLDIPDEANLPPLWHKWANCSKRQEFNVLTDLLQVYS